MAWSKDLRGMLTLEVGERAAVAICNESSGERWSRQATVEGRALRATVAPFQHPHCDRYCLCSRAAV